MNDTIPKSRSRVLNCKTEAHDGEHGYLAQNGNGSPSFEKTRF